MGLAILPLINEHRDYLQAVRSGSLQHAFECRPCRPDPGAAGIHIVIALKEPGADDRRAALLSISENRVHGGGAGSPAAEVCAAGHRGQLVVVESDEPPGWPANVSAVPDDPTKPFADASAPLDVAGTRPVTSRTDAPAISTVTLAVCHRMRRPPGLLCPAASCQSSSAMVTRGNPRRVDNPGSPRARCDPQLLARAEADMTVFAHARS